MSSIVNTNSTKPIVLSLYSKLLRIGSQFNAYNFREYTLRRIKEEFHLHSNDTDSIIINEQINNAKKYLELLNRQVPIQNTYYKGVSIMDNKKQ